VISMLRVALLVGLFAPRCAFAETTPSDLPSADGSDFGQRITLGPGTQSEERVVPLTISSAPAEVLHA
jgi:hypothetical protein